jgi:L-alanine-DL-glutamate epimerase-like enolase superfamily enzyme
VTGCRSNSEARGDLGQFRRRAPFKTAAGESLYLPQGIGRLVERGVVDIAQPDILRMGGITPMLLAFGLIEAKNLPVAPHHFPELMTPLLGASPNALYIEYLPMFEQAPVIDRGMIRPLDVPGHGIRLPSRRTEDRPVTPRWQDVQKPAGRSKRSRCEAAPDGRTRGVLSVR